MIPIAKANPRDPWVTTSPLDNPVGDGVPELVAANIVVESAVEIGAES